MANKKSDVTAKRDYKKHLIRLGYSNVQITKQPADIIAEKEGETFYFEIKMTRQTDQYFGAATITEWKAAIKNPVNFKFVIAIANDDESQFSFKEYTPEEFIRHSTIPPFKIFFNLDLKNESFTPKRRSALQATKENIKTLIDVFHDLKLKR